MDKDKYIIYIYIYIYIYIGCVGRVDRGIVPGDEYIHMDIGI